MPIDSSERSRQGNVQGSVYASLRKSIINLNLAPGTAVSEKEISLLYKVSRTPVREAFINLSKEGLVQVIPQRETKVSLIDFGRVEQEFFLRESLEMAVMEPFIHVHTASHIAELEACVETQAEAGEGNEYIKFLNADDRFHSIFFRAAGHDLGWQVLESMCGHYHRVRLLSIWLNGIARDIVGQHREILAAIGAKDIAGVRACLSRHIHKLDTEEELLREKYPDYFRSRRNEDAFDVDFSGLSIRT
ncbi:MAG: GntR family transcriptional regulator [Treponema sp.]|jgi:DNA-binding GntR family transcriptional regulator|nr:GntR family transcriptional regulator [Treponema sp.]